MPLTFAHPAAVVPLMRGPLVPTALVAGALAPDVPYFLRSLPIPVSAQSWWEPFLNATTTHSWPGILSVAMPLALVLFLGLAVCVRPGLWALPTTPAPQSAARTSKAVWWLWVGASLAIGVLSHVAWDSFTHSDGWFVENVAWVRTEAFGSLTWARLLQHLSTAFGLTVIAVAAWRRRETWLVSTDTARRARFLRVAAVLASSAMAAMVGAVLLLRDAGDGAEHLLSDAAIGAGLGASIAAAALALLWWVVRPDRMT